MEEGLRFHGSGEGSFRGEGWGRLVGWATASAGSQSVASLFSSSRGGEAANDREKQQAVEECKQKGYVW
ncbi:hypothetical protein TRIUR3_30204 [Triticum urartu]|uniref:Uncharacterized protein n=1 Tax=Triticum urartu TaxID=4572 RepID=M7YPE9_TRIUA|nr:hypothetical protein TRIUR3_30204 [Triticum urartu]